MISSDLGQPPNPLHTDGLLAIYKGLMAHGISAADIDVMSRKNPARLLGLEPVRERPMASERNDDETTQKSSMDRRAAVKGALAAAGALGLGSLSPSVYTLNRAPALRRPPPARRSRSHAS